MSLGHSRSLLLAGDHASDLIVLWRCEWWLMLLWPASSCCVGCVAWLWWWDRAVPCCLLSVRVFSHSTYSTLPHPFCLSPPPPSPTLSVYTSICQSSLSFSSPFNAVAFFLVLLPLVFSQSPPPPPPPPPPPQPPLSSQSVKSGVRFERSEWQLLLVEVKLRTFFGWNQGWTCDCRTWLIQYLCQHYRFLYVAFLYSCVLCCLLLQGNERQCHSVDNGRHERGVHGAAESDEAGAEDEPHQVHHQPGLHRPQQPAAPPPGGQRHHHHPGELLSAPAEPACAVSPKLLLTPRLRWSFVVDSTLKSEN